MVRVDALTLQKYNSNPRYRCISPSYEQSKRGVVAIYEDTKMKQTPNSTYSYIVIIHDPKENIYQSFVDASEEAIKVFWDDDFPMDNTKK